MGDELEEARATIARQAEEIERLRRRLSDESFAEDLGQTLTLAAAVGTVASPVKHGLLLKMIVETAAAVIGARAGSLFLIDLATDELVFEVAFGSRAEQIEGHRMPAGRGIAGLVARSGQPMAISDARDNPQVFKDIGDRIGYHPESILCVPLFYADRVLGVFEMLDKVGAPAFSSEDMRTLGMFANQAAVAIELSRTYRHVAPLIGELLASLGHTAADQRRTLLERSEAFAAHVEEEVSYRETLDLATIIQEIAWRGEEERAACLAILRGFADYLRSRPELEGM
jgi:GAF domain-containing protein